MVVRGMVRGFRGMFGDELLLMNSGGRDYFTFTTTSAHSVSGTGALFGYADLPLGRAFHYPRDRIRFLGRHFKAGVVSGHKGHKRVRAVSADGLMRVVGPNTVMLTHAGRRLVSLFLSLLQGRVPTGLVGFSLLGFFSSLVNRVRGGVKVS